MRASNTRLSRKSPPRPSANRTWLGTVLPASTYIVGCTYGTMLTVGARGEAGDHEQPEFTPHARLLSDQKRTPPVRMKVLPPPSSPRPSTNGMSVLRFTLNVVPPSRFSPAFVSEPLTPAIVTDAWAMFSPPPA